MQRNMTLHKVSLENLSAKEHNFLSFYDQLSVCVFLDIITHSPRSLFPMMLQTLIIACVCVIVHPKISVSARPDVNTEN